MSDFSEQLRLMLRVMYIRRNRDVIIQAADEIERLTAAFKLAHEQARSNALEIKVRGNQLAAANKRIAALEADAACLSAEVKNDWEKGRVSVDTFHAALAMDKALAAKEKQ